MTILLTGSEVVEDGIPEPGQVRDAFGPQLPTFVEMLGETPAAYASRAAAGRPHGER